MNWRVPGMRIQTGSLVVLSTLRGEFFIDGLAMADRHDADRTSLSIDSIDDAEPANAKLPQPVEFAQQRVAAFWVDGNCTKR